MLVFPKIAKTWLPKPIKAKKDHSYLKEIIQETIECAASKTTLQIPVIPSSPENIANVQKPNEEEVIKEQISRFHGKF